jgi:hypothetical protein
MLTLTDRFRLAYRLVARAFHRSNLLAHAENELAIVYGAAQRQTSEAKDLWMQAEINRNLLELIAVFATQGHSGSSAAYARGMLDRLLDFKPIAPLTGADAEWVEVGRDVFQNRRCSRVFREGVRAYDSAGRVFVDADGEGYTNGASRVEVAFPYVPRTVYVTPNGESFPTYEAARAALARSISLIHQPKGDPNG